MPSGLKEDIEYALKELDNCGDWCSQSDIKQEFFPMDYFQKNSISLPVTVDNTVTLYSVIRGEAIQQVKERENSCIKINPVPLIQRFSYLRDDVTPITMKEVETFINATT